ncbi:MAG: sulfatase family protein [Polyangiaceae bacterium]
MRIALSDCLAPAFVLVLAGAAAMVAWRTGGGADARERPPSANAGSASNRDGSSVRALGGDAYEVRTRLVDALEQAQVEVPNLAAAMPAFRGYWRKLRGPWARPAGVAGELVTTISLRTSDKEVQWAVPTHSGREWVPQARVWNMNEGSYDQRESIFAPTPATLTFHLVLPERARLRIATALVAPFSTTTTFEVTIVDAGGQAHTVSETHVDGGNSPGARGWHDLDIDLSPWGGQHVDLRLATRTDHPGAISTHTDTVGVDGGTDDQTTAASAASLALWGDPLIVAPEPTRLPFDVLWIVVDALRPDVIAALHDPAEDRAKLAAQRPPLEALLPAIPGLMPTLDALTARAVHFEHAWSAASWTRPGTLAMLSGLRSSELGIDTTAWILPPSEPSRYYASDPPLLPLILKKRGAVTAAFVNNFFMSGYAAVGLDMGFERLTDHRYLTRDTAAITRDATAWLDAHGKDRFFLFINYNSPHDPYDPPEEMLARVPKAPDGPSDPQVRKYMAEGAKDDAAIGTLLEKIEALGLTKTTLVVVTSDHGETLSSAHEGLGLRRMPLRFHHAVGMFEETTRIPIIMALPGVLDGGRTVKERVRNIDIAPTVLDVEGMEADPRMSGRSMLPLLGKDAASAPPRPVLSEGRAARALLWENWRLVVHDPTAPEAPRPGDEATGAAKKAPLASESQRWLRPIELFDLQTDPGERRDVARQHPDVVAAMKARLVAAKANVPTADAPTPAASPLPTVHFRFAGAGRARRVSGTLTIGDGKRPVTIVVTPAGIAPAAARAEPREAGAGAEQVVDFALTTYKDSVVGFDVRVDPPAAPIVWRLFLDDAPWPSGATFAGPFGLPAVAALSGITTADAETEVYSPELPFIDPGRDTGVFITRDKAGDAVLPAQSESSPAAARETERMLEEWGYAHKRERREKGQEAVKP